MGYAGAATFNGVPGISWGKADGTLASILGANNVNKKGKDVYQFDVFRIVNGSIQLSSGVQARLQEGLNSDASTATCENLIDSAFAAWAVYQTWKTMPNFSGFGITTANDALFLPTSFNSFGHKSHRFETLIPGTDYGTANRFYGVQEGLFRRTPAP